MIYKLFCLAHTLPNIRWSVEKGGASLKISITLDDKQKVEKASLRVGLPQLVDKPIVNRSG
jgi:hypothetical protein